MRDVFVLTVQLSYFALVFALRTLLHKRRTGSSGFRGITGTPGSPAWWGGCLFVVALALVLAAPVLVRLEIEELIWSPSILSDVVGVIVVVLAMAGTWWSQSAMGRWWRIGVRETERTELVVTGPFRWMRNPIFSFMIAATAGLAWLLPTVSAFAALLLLIVAVELQVRVVEEPYLHRAHGERYTAYCRAVGRFVPLVGRQA